METLTPVQRVSVITIGLTLTVVIVVLAYPWASRQLAALVPPTPTPLPPTATCTPTATLTPTPLPTPTPTVALTPPPPRLATPPLTVTLKAADDGGPLALSLALSHWGYTDTQQAIAQDVRPGEDDLHVSVGELAEYARARGADALVGAGGAITTVRGLLANGFPVIVARWMTDTGGAGVMRYQLVRGYDHLSATLTLYNPAAGAEVTLSYGEMDAGWRGSNRRYLVVYPPDEKRRVWAVVARRGEKEMWQGALAQARHELQADADDALARLNEADALTALARYGEAWSSFEQAIGGNLPPRILWYRLSVYRCLLKLGEYDKVLKLSQSALQGGARMEELHLYRARAYAALGNADQARKEYDKALQIHPRWKPAEEGLKALGE